MMEFIKAALPWVMVGIAIAIFIVRVVQKTKLQKQKGPGAKGDCMTLGMCFGMCVGVTLAVSGLMDMAFAVPLCVLIGQLVGILIKY